MKKKYNYILFLIIFSQLKYNFLNTSNNFEIALKTAEIATGFFVGYIIYLKINNYSLKKQNKKITEDNNKNKNHLDEIKCYNQQANWKLKNPDGTDSEDNGELSKKMITKIEIYKSTQKISQKKIMN